MRQRHTGNIIFKTGRLLTWLVWLICLMSGTAWAKGILFKGSLAVLPVAQLVAEAYMRENPSVLISVDGGGTARGIKALIQGTAQVGMASVEISDELKHFADEKGVELVFHKIGHDSVIPVVHPYNPVYSLSLEQLRQAYAGTISNWKEIGGKDAPIELLTLSRLTGSYDVWRGYVMTGETPMTPDAMQCSEERLHRLIRGNPNAIGYLPIKSVSKGVRPLSINGVYGNVSSIMAGKFPIRRLLGLYVRKGDPDPDIRELVRYFRDPDIGQYLMKSKGMIPLE